MTTQKTFKTLTDGFSCPDNTAPDSLLKVLEEIAKIPFNGQTQNVPLLSSEQQMITAMDTIIKSIGETANESPPTEKRKLVATRSTGAWNFLNYVRATYDNTTIDEITGNVSIKYGKHVLYFDKYGERPVLNDFTRDMWKFITLRVTSKEGFNEKDLLLEFSANDVATALNRANNWRLREEIIESLEVLGALRLPFKKTPKAKAPFWVNISRGAGPLSNGLYGFSMTPESYSILMKAALMRISQSILCLDRQKYPGSSAVMTRLYEDLNMNIGTKKEGIISVKALLDACPEIPSESEVRKSNRAFTQRRSMPLEKILEYLVEAGELDEYHYTHANSKPLTDEELANFTDYSLYKGLYVHYKIKGYQYEQTRADAAENRKKRRVATKKAQDRKVKAAQSKTDASATEQADKKKNLRP